MAEMMWWTQSLIRCSCFKTQFGAFQVEGVLLSRNCTTFDCK